MAARTTSPAAGIAGSPRSRRATRQPATDQMPTASAGGGENRRNAKLTAAEVTAIRRRYNRGNGPALAREFGVGHSAVLRIVRGTTWKHLPNQPAPVAAVRQVRLSAAEVREIRDWYAHGDVTQQQIAAEYGVGQQAISRIVRGESWRTA
jgi:predicted DNA-binding protein (UPF0251 family)